MSAWVQLLDLSGEWDWSLRSFSKLLLLLPPVLFALPDRWNIFTSSFAQLKRQFGVPQALPIFPWRNRLLLLRLNCFGAEHTSEVMGAIFQKFSPLSWIWRKWSTVEERQCVNTEVRFDSVDRPWQEWRNELCENTRDVQQRVVICSGYAPLSMWMLLGRTLAGKGKEVVVVNFKRSGETGQVFPLTASSDQPQLLTLDLPHTFTSVAVLYVSLNPRSQFSQAHEDRVKTLVSVDNISVCRLHPGANFITVDSQTIMSCARDIDAALGDIASRGATTLVLATSGVDAVAFLIGSLANPSKFNRIVYLDFVRGNYEVAFDC
eukprot:m.211387 g.211387  ORF g.211387 m.211387 type:complete len:320 (-) comp18268_c0_seq1:281-1240(-)